MVTNSQPTKSLAAVVLSDEALYGSGKETKAIPEEEREETAEPEKKQDRNRRPYPVYDFDSADDVF